jgi:dUTP pyrophosphatase
MDEISTNDNSTIVWKDTIEFVAPIEKGFVIKVYDGDTITIASKLPYETSPLYRFSVRLNGIDCPEMKGKDENEKECAQIAKKEMNDLIMNKMVTLKNIQTQGYDLNTDSTSSLFESLGINLDELSDQFDSQFENKLELRYTNNSENEGPEYAYESDSGFDLRSTEELWVQGNDRKLIPTGLRFDIPDGYEIQVRSKSGLALNQGLMVLNSPGTVDSGYQGEIKVIIFNTTNEKIKIEKGQKIAQAVLCPVVNGKWVNLVKVEEIGEKDRNDKGFGSTGLK